MAKHLDVSVVAVCTLDSGKIVSSVLSLTTHIKPGQETAILVEALVDSRFSFERGFCEMLKECGEISTLLQITAQVEIVRLNEDCRGFGSMFFDGTSFAPSNDLERWREDGRTS